MLNAFCRVAPSVRLSAFAIAPAGFFFLARDLSVRTCSVLQAARFCFFGIFVLQISARFVGIRRLPSVRVCQAHSTKCDLHPTRLHLTVSSHSRIISSILMRLHGNCCSHTIWSHKIAWTEHILVLVTDDRMLIRRELLGTRNVRCSTLNASNGRTQRQQVLPANIGLMRCQASVSLHSPLPKDHFERIK